MIPADIINFLSLESIGLPTNQLPFLVVCCCLHFNLLKSTFYSICEGWYYVLVKALKLAHLFTRMEH